ncbi:hypothetical protein [Kitasatospora sp. NPDC001225]
MREEIPPDPFDYGITGLSTQFHLDFEGTPLDVARKWACADAARLKDDITRLGHPDLPERSVSTVWRAASGLVGLSGIRSWMAEVTELCDLHLAQGGVFPAPAADRAELAGEVLAELGAVADALDLAARQSLYPIEEVANALDQTIRLAGPNLGFRFFLRCLIRYWVKIDGMTYRRFVLLGDRLGLGEQTVPACRHLLMED